MLMSPFFQEKRKSIAGRERGCGGGASEDVRHCVYP